MRSFVGKVAQTVSDLTVGTVIVLVHVALADRDARRGDRLLPQATRDGGRLWPSQISP